ncbi:MAG: hypothetical protein ACU0CO_10555 [Shimia sp.]
MKTTTFALATILTLTAPAAFAGPASQGALGVCDGPAFEAKVTARFKERYPSLKGPIEAQPPKLVRTAQILVQNECRTQALMSCEASADPEACRGEMAVLWTDEAQTTRDALRTALTEVAVDALPPLQRGRLASEANWVQPIDCGTDGTLCEARTALHMLKSLEARQAEVAALEG